MAIETLPVSDLQDVLAGSKSRGTYDAQLKEFVESGEAGGRVDLEEGIFKGKKPQTVKAGFETAKERALKLVDANPDLKHVEIRNKQSQVYLIRTDLI